MINSMSRHHHPIEQLLRPAHEFPVGLAYYAAAILCVMSPSVIMGSIYTPSITYGVACLFLIRGTQRVYWASRLKKYQYELHVLPEYAIKSTQIPVSKKLLFLGLGFEWRARHSQRRYDIDRIEFDYHKDATEGSLYKTARKYEEQVHHLYKLPLPHALNKALINIVAPTQFKHWLNPLAPRPYVEGVPAIHGVGLWETGLFNSEKEIGLQQSERVAHNFVVGTTRVGKTRLAEVLITQDIHNGDVVIVFDPKGDAELLKRCYVEAKRAGREHQFYCFHLGFPEMSARYNPIGTFGRITEPATRVASQLPGEGASAAFREFTWRYVNVMSKALTTIGKTITYENLLHYGADIDPLLQEYLAHVMDRPESTVVMQKNGVFDWRKAVKAVEENPDIKPDRTQSTRDRGAWATAKVYKDTGLTDATAHALIKTFEYEKSFYDKLVASLFPLLEKLTSGPTAALLSPDYLDLSDKRPIFDWDDVIRTGGIVYVGLDALSDAEVSQAVGNSMFSDLTSRAGAIYKGSHTNGLPDEIAKKIKKRKICLHADEFNELVGKEFIPMANKAGGAGFQLTVYTQTLSDIKARFGDDAKAGQVIGNLGTLIMLRVKEKKTAELLTDQLGDVEVNHLTMFSGSRDDLNPDSSIDFTSSTEQGITTQRVPMISTGDLMSLPKGQAFARMGGKLYKIRLPLFTDEDDLPQGMAFMAAEMRKRYQSSTTDLKWSEVPEIKLNEFKGN